MSRSIAEKLISDEFIYTREEKTEQNISRCVQEKRIIVMIKLSTTTVQPTTTISNIILTTTPDPLLFFQFRKYTTNLEYTLSHVVIDLYHHFLTFSPFMAICTTVSGSSIAIFDFLLGERCPAQILRLFVRKDPQINDCCFQEGSAAANIDFT